MEKETQAGIPPRSIRLKRVITRALICVLLIVFSFDAAAGFKRKGAVRIRIGGEGATKAGLEAARKKGVAYPPIEKALTPAVLTELGKHEPFKSLPDNAARQKRMNEIRERLLCSCEVIKKQYPALASIIKGIYAKNNFCLEFRLRFGRFLGQNLLKVKGTRGSARARINFNVFPRNPAASGSDIYDEEGFRFIAGLIHQACVIKSQTSQAMPKAKNASTAAKLKDVCAQWDAEMKTLQWLRTYRVILIGIAANDKLLPGLKGIGVELGAELLKDPDFPTPASRSAEASRLVVLVDCWLVGVSSRERQLSRKKTSLSRQSSLPLPDQPSGHYIDFKGSTELSVGVAGTDGISYTILATGGEYADDGTGEFEPDNSIDIRAFPPDAPELPPVKITFSEVDVLTGGALDRSTGSLFVSGYRDEVGGKLFFVGDSDGNGVPDAPPMQIQTGLDHPRGSLLKLPPGAAPGELLIMDCATRALIHATDSNPGDPNPVPDRFTPIGNLGPAAITVRELICSEDGLEVFGTEGDGIGTDFVVPGYIYPRAERQDTSSSFLPSLPLNLFEELEFPPTLDLPVAGATSLPFTGMPFGEYQLLGTPAGGKTMLLDSRCCGPTGSGTFLFPTKPLPENMTVEISDVMNGIPCPPRVTELAPRFDVRIDELFPGPSLEDPTRVALSVTGQPNSRARLEIGNDPNRFEPGDLVDIGGDGIGFQEVEVTQIPGTPTFIRARQVEADLSAFSEETFTVTPGGLTTIDLLDSISEPIPGLSFQLLEPPPEFNGVFKSHGDGQFTFNVPSFGTSFTFTYQVSDGHVLSAPFTISVEPGDRTDLIDPPGFVDEQTGEFIVEAPVLILEDGLSYPIYQFTSANRRGDSCIHPHWHGHDAIPLEDPLTLIPFEELYDFCGYGLIFPFYDPATAPTVPQDIYYIDLESWEAFKVLVAP